jgi:hypothetical protein
MMSGNNTITLFTPVSARAATGTFTQLPAPPERREI